MVAEAVGATSHQAGAAALAAKAEAVMVAVIPVARAEATAAVEAVQDSEAPVETETGEISPEQATPNLNKV